MQRKISFSHYSIRHKLGHFWQNTQGVYAVMTSLLSFVLIGYIAFVVDGTGLVLDKVRLTQGLEQAGFLLTAEDNNYRDEKNIYEVNSQSNLLTPTEIEAAKVKGSLSDIEAKNLITSVNQFYQHSIKNDEDFKDNTFYKRYARNMQMIKGIVRSYYLPNSYTAYKEGGNGENNFNINDHFSYLCGEIKNTRNIGCLVDGNFNRPSWLYWGKQYKKEYGTTFDRTEKVAANTVFITKQKHDNPPIDMMLITDMSGSMTESLNSYSVPKIKMLRNAFSVISNEMLQKKYNDQGGEIKNYNRIGFTSFAYGSQQFDITRGINNQSTNTLNQCILPYKLTTKAFERMNKEVSIDKNYFDLDGLMFHVCSKKGWSRHKCSKQYKNEHNKGRYFCRFDNESFRQPDPRLNQIDTCHCPQNGCTLNNQVRVLKVINNGIPSYKDSFEKEYNAIPANLNDLDGNPDLKDKLNLLGRGLSEEILYGGIKFYPVDIPGTINLIKNFKPNTAFPHQQDMIHLKKGTMCLNNNNIGTTKLWYDKNNLEQLNNIDFKSVIPSGATLASSGLLIGAHLMVNTNKEKEASPNILKLNTKRYIIILSDGIDAGVNRAYDTPDITLNLIDAGMCNVIRDKLRSLQDKNYKSYEPRISFIMLGADNAQIEHQGIEKVKRFEEKWRQCVNTKPEDNNYFNVNNEKELIEALRIASGLTEEVGTASDSKPDFKK